MLSHTEAPCVMFIVRRPGLLKFITLINGVHFYVHRSYFNEVQICLGFICIEIEHFHVRPINTGAKGSKENDMKSLTFKEKTFCAHNV